MILFENFNTDSSIEILNIILLLFINNSKKAAYLMQSLEKIKVIRSIVEVNSSFEKKSLAAQILVMFLKSFNSKIQNE